MNSDDLKYIVSGAHKDVSVLAHCLGVKNGDPCSWRQTDVHGNTAVDVNYAAMMHVGENPRHVVVVDVYRRTIYTGRWR